MDTDETITVACPGCARKYPFTAAYVAEFGGLYMDCACGQSLLVPTSETLSASQIVSTVPTEPPPLRGVWQDGRCVVVARGTRMPDRCQICNAPLTVAAKVRTLRWVPPEHRRRIPRRPIGMAIRFVASAMEDDHSRSIAVRVGRCPRHRVRPQALVAVLAGISAAVAVTWAFVARSDSQQMIALVIAGALAMTAAIAAWLLDRIRIVDYQGTVAWIRGYGRAYVDPLPTIPMD
jgi:hypothetical protein